VLLVTYKELEQYRALVKEIKDLKERIAKTQKITDCVKGSKGYYPYTKRTITIEDSSSGILEDKLQFALQRAESELIKLHDYINGIDDSWTRTLFRHKFIDGWSMGKLSCDFYNGSDESAPRKYINRYIKKHNS